VVLGSAEKLIRLSQNKKGLSTEDVMPVADKIVQNARRIGKIVNGLRSFARDGSKDELIVENAQRVIQESIDLCVSRITNQGIEIIANLPKVEVPIRVRSVQISEVLLNLINNATDAIQNLPEKWIKISLEEKAGWVQIRVTDSGLGIPQELLGKIMEPFFTTKEVGKGTGLGLSVSKSIVEDHGGRLFYDVKSKHTSFVIEIPGVASAHVSEETQGRPRPFNSKKVA
jgi:C4-dicarboxylate-specific signal transduction histidine kinase